VLRRYMARKEPSGKNGDRGEVPDAMAFAKGLRVTHVGRGDLSKQLVSSAIICEASNETMPGRRTLGGIRVERPRRAM
jgi:hypothetical protein